MLGTVTGERPAMKKEESKLLWGQVIGLWDRNALFLLLSLFLSFIFFFVICFRWAYFVGCGSRRKCEHRGWKCKLFFLSFSSFFFLFFLGERKCINVSFLLEVQHPSVEGILLIA